jgi:hypothetical protein
MKSSATFLLASLAIACTTEGVTTPPPVTELGVMFRVPDFRSELRFGDLGRPGALADDPAVLAVLTTGDVREEIDEATVLAVVAAGTHLTRVADGVEIPLEIHTDIRNIEGTVVEVELGGWSFVPEEPIGPGWHTLRVDLSGLVELGQDIHWEGDDQRRGDVLYARFRVDAATEWVFSAFRCSRRDHGGLLPVAEQRCMIGGAVSQADPVEWAGTSIAIRFDGVDAGCEDLAFDDVSFGASCPLPATLESTIEIEMTGGAVAGPNGGPTTVHRVVLRDLVLPVGTDDWWSSNTVVPVAPEMGLE